MIPMSVEYISAVGSSKSEINLHLKIVITVSIHLTILKQFKLTPLPAIRKAFSVNPFQNSAIESSFSRVSLAERGHAAS